MKPTFHQAPFYLSINFSSPLPGILRNSLATLLKNHSDKTINKTLSSSFLHSRFHFTFANPKRAINPSVQCPNEYDGSPCDFSIETLVHTFRIPFLSPRAAFVKQFPSSRDSKIPLRRINSDIFIGVRRRHAFGACRFYYRLYSHIFFSFFLFHHVSYRVSQKWR